MKNLKYLSILIFSIFSCTRFEDPNIGLSNKIEIITNKVTVISSDTALYEGNIIREGNEGITERGFAYNTISNPKITNKTVKSGLGIGTYFAKATDLLPDTKYYVAAYATNKSGTVYGSDIGFNTPKSAPRLSPTLVTSFTPYSALITSNITLDGGSPILERGICWSSKPGALITTNKVVSNSTANAFDTPISNLTPGGTYYIKSFASNAIGTGYGQEIILKTLDIKLPSPDPNCLPTTSISYTEATVNANITNDGLSNKLETGIILSTSSKISDLTYNNISSQTVKSSLNTLGKISIVFSSLSVGTKYYYVSYAKNEAGISYSPICSFSTLDYSLPTVDLSCINSTNIGIDIATINGNVLSDGGVSNIEKGFIFSTKNTDLTYQNPLSQTLISTETAKGTYSYVITSLKANTKYYYRSYGKNLKGVAYGPICNFNTIDYSEPKLMTTCIIPTDITSNSIKIYGEVNDDGGDVNLEKGFVYGNSTNLVYIIGSSNTLVSSGKGKGTFSFVILNLNKGTTYYYKSYAINSTGKLVYGPLCEFKTLEFSEPKLNITCLTPTNITNVSAKIYGEVTDDGGDISLEKGFIYGTTNKLEYLKGANNVLTSSNKGNGSYSFVLTNLSSRLTYYYKSYAINKLGVLVYGPLCQFTTNAPEKPTLNSTCLPTSALNFSDATLNGNLVSWGGDNYSTEREIGVIWSTSFSNIYNLNPIGTKTQSNWGGDGTGAVSVYLPSLNPGTTYYYKFYAKNMSGITYGPQCSFQTNNYVIPQVQGVCYPPEKVTSNSASLYATGGNGGKLISSGFIYGIGINEYSTVNSSNVKVANSPVSTTFNGAFGADLTNLKPETVYNYRAFITSPAGTGYGPLCTLITSREIIIPKVITNPMTRPMPLVTQLNGSITDNGGSAIIEKGFIWSTNASFTSSTKTFSFVNSTNITANFTYSQTGITIYFKAFATNSAGTGYGNVLSFTYQ